MTLPDERKRPFSQMLGVRLAFAFAVSLLPLGLISGMQSRSLMDEAKARSTAALLGETLLAAAPEARLIRGARVAAEALAITIPGLADNTDQCSAALRRLVEHSDGAYSFIAFIPQNGDARCTSSGEVVDFSTSKRLAQMAASPKADTVVILEETQSHESVLAFGYPVLDFEGDYLGYVSISMPHSVLESPDMTEIDFPPSDQMEPITLITFDTSGTILTATSGLDNAAGRLPNDRSLTELTSNAARTFTATSKAGDSRIFAVFPLVEDTIYAIGSWPIIVAGGPLSLWVSPYLMPAMMWLASLLVAMLAAERLVTRHVRSLRKSITGFAAGSHRVADLNMGDAAVEIRDVGEAYLKMTDTILHDEAELENMVHQREVLLREVHHRVKNNLQLISSIMNMQMRQSHSSEAKLLMKGLQDRVMSLATIHRGLYQTSGLADVRADELLSDIVRQILKMATGPGRAFNVTSHFDDLRLTPDQAVPLSLLLTEALTNAIKYADTNGSGLPNLGISLRRENATDAILEVSNSIKTGPARVQSEKSTGLGSQLLTAFGQQLAAESSSLAEDDVYRLRVKFAVRSLTEAEARSAESHTTSPEPEDAAAR